MLLHRLRSRRADVAFWSAWLACAALFAGLAAWCGRRYALPLDIRLTRWVQDLDRYPRMDAVFRHVNDAGDYAFIAGVLLLGFVWLLLRGLRFEALILAGAGALRYVQLGVREIVHRPFDPANPPWFNDSLPGLRAWPGPDGFPSGHVFGEWAVYGLIFAYARRAIPFAPLAWAVRAFCVAEIALGGPARMYTGAHWPSDVVGSVLLALLYLGLAWKIDGAVAHIRDVTSERDLAAEAGLSAASSRARWRFMRRALVPALPAAESPAPEPARTR
jgi:undecaprenyl-diphosphatase